MKINVSYSKLFILNFQSRFLFIRLAKLIVLFFLSMQILAQQSTSGPKPLNGISRGEVNKTNENLIIINGVPAYTWQHGCGPTALGMIIGYYDLNGFSDLIPGNSSTQTTAVNNAIANIDHYSDYSLPLDEWPDPVQPDASETGNAHTSNCLGDFMRTSWSIENNYYGWSWFSHVSSSFTDYIEMINDNYITTTSNHLYSTSCWNIYTNEIDNNRPVILLVDTDGNGNSDHFVTGIGYDDISNEFAVYDTWDHNTHWFDWQEISSGNLWGIYGIVLCDIHLPGIPVLIYPENGQQNVAVNTAFFWNPLVGADSYDFALYDYVNGYLQQIYYQSGITSTDYIPSDFTFEYAEWYKWTVRARENGQIGDWATLWSFETEYYLDEPTLQSPPDLSENISLTPTFIWENIPGADYYRIEICTDPDMNDEVANFNNIPNNYFDLPLGYLDPTIEYHWSVRAYSSEGNSDWCVPYRFTTGGFIPPGPPLLVLPEDEATNISLNPQLQWEEGVGVSLMYNLEIATDINFTQIIHQMSEIEYVLYTVPVEVLNSQTIYYWRVAGVNGSGTGSFSETFSFTTGDPEGQGSILWSYGTLKVEGIPVFDNEGYIYINSSSDLVKVNPVTGQEIFIKIGYCTQEDDQNVTFSHNGTVMYSIVHDNDIPGLPITDRKYLVALDKEANLIWYYETPFETNQYIWKPILDSEGNIYIYGEEYNQSDQDAVISVDPNGNYRWHKTFIDKDNGITCPVSSGNLLFIAREETGSGTSDAAMYALNTSNGNIAWSNNMGGSEMMSVIPAISQNSLIFGRYDDKLFSINKTNGSTTTGWPFVAVDRFNATSIIDENGIIFNGIDEDNGSTLAYAFYPSGTTKWQKEIVDDYEKSAVLGNDGKLYFASNTHEIYCVDKETGIEDWSINIDKNVYSMTIGPNGTLYVGTSASETGTFYAIQTTATGLLESDWPCAVHDYQGTCCFDHQNVLPSPSITSFTINNGDAITENDIVSLNNSALYNPTHFIASEQSDFSNASWIIYDSQPNFTLSSESGLKTVYFKVKNVTGESDPVSDDIYYSSPLPEVTDFSINNAEYMTLTPIVTLNNDATNTPTHYMASEDPFFVGGVWMTYESAPIFTLSPDYGLKTVYLKVKNDVGESNIVEDEIELISDFAHYNLDIKVYLEGPYSIGNMVTYLNPDYLPLDQPYDMSPWNYNGSESVISIPNNEIVDWVYLEIHDVLDPSLASNQTIVEQMATFVKSDGSIVDIDGTSFPKLYYSTDNNLFVAIYHRNHLGIISANPLEKFMDIYQYNFTNSPFKAYGNLLAQKPVLGGMAMIGGDGNADGIIDENDKSFWTSSVGLSGYLESDFNLNGQVENPDKNDIWFNNIGYSSQIPIMGVVPSLAHWKFTEMSGSTITDISGNENHGSISGASWVSGYFDGALSFDGNDEVVIGSVLSPGFDHLNYTIEAVLKVDPSVQSVSDYNTDGPSTYFGKMDGTSSSDDYPLLLSVQKIDGTENLRFSTNALGGIETAFTTDQWLHIAYIVDETSKKLYINHDLIASTDYTPSSNWGDQIWTIGNWHGSSTNSWGYFRGIIDEIRVTNDLLTQEQFLPNPN